MKYRVELNIDAPLYALAEMEVKELPDFLNTEEKINHFLKQRLLIRLDKNLRDKIIISKI